MEQLATFKGIRISSNHAWWAAIYLCQKATQALFNSKIES